MKVRLDQLEDLRGRKRLCECADRAEFFCFVEHLRTAVRRDQKDGYLRLYVEQIGDDLVPGYVRQKEIDDTKTEAPVARLIDAVTAVSYEHNFIAVRLKDQPERVAY